MEWEALPAELQRAILLDLPAVDLARVSTSCAKLHGLACVVAELRLRQVLPRLAPGSDATPCWLRSLGCREQTTCFAGARPAASWRDEFVDLMVAAAEASFKRDPTSPLPLERWEYEAAGELGIDNASSTFLASSIDRKVAGGWSREEAIQSETLDCSTLVVVASSPRRYPATVHSHVELYSELARRAAEVPEELYCNLLGTAALPSLADCDPAWSSKALLRRGVGGSFVSKTVVFGVRSLAHLSDARGWRDTVDDLLEDIRVIPTDVVCIRSAPKGAGGFRALIHENWSVSNRRVTRSAAIGEEEDVWIAPIGTHITLERVQQPGEWRGYEGGPLMRVRLFTVSISFG